VDPTYSGGIHEEKMNGRKLKSLRRKEVKPSSGWYRGGIHETKMNGRKLES